MKTIAVFSALKEEIKNLKKTGHFSPVQTSSGWQVWKGQTAEKEVLLILTGVGKKKAQRCAEWALKEFPIDLIISTGFAGALDTGSKAGEVVVYSRLISDESKSPTSEKGMAVVCDPGLVKLARECAAGPAVRTNLVKGISIDRVCASPEAKSSLGSETGCQAVDMESFWIGQIAAEKKIPFVTVRSIIDEVGDDLSFLDRISEGGKIAPTRILKWLLTNPGGLKILVSSYRNYRRAAANLSVVMQAVVRKV